MGGGQGHQLPRLRTEGGPYFPRVFTLGILEGGGRARMTGAGCSHALYSSCVREQTVCLSACLPACPMPQPSSLSRKLGRSGLLIRTRSAEPLLCARPFRGARLAASPGGGVRSKGLPQSPVSGKARGSTGLTGNSCFFPTVLKGAPSWMTRALPRFGLAEAGNRFILHAPHTPDQGKVPHGGSGELASNTQYS